MLPCSPEATSDQQSCQAPMLPQHSQQVPTDTDMQDWDTPDILMLPQHTHMQDMPPPTLDIMDQDYSIDNNALALENQLLFFAVKSL